nr:hypothetical protein [Candidatus Sigynarchaeota archaeon]
MTQNKHDVVWTIKVDAAFDKAAQRILELYGYKSKAEIVREAVREFLIRRGLANLLGGEVIVPGTSPMSPIEALGQIKAALTKVPKGELAVLANKARDDVAKEFLGEQE